MRPYALPLFTRRQGAAPEIRGDHEAAGQLCREPLQALTTPGHEGHGRTGTVQRACTALTDARARTSHHRNAPIEREHLHPANIRDEQNGSTR
jgi:hypothetical protein